jgi:DNA-binding transcriptional LysR family regulator
MARHAIAVLQDERRAFGEFDALRGLRRGEISVVAAESLNTAFLPEVLAQMARRYPAIVSRIRTAGSNQIPGALLRGEADLGLAFSLPRHRDLQQLAVGRFRLGAIVTPGHKLAAEATDGTVSFAQCARHPLILPASELSIHSLLEASLNRFAGRLQVLAEVNSLPLMKTLAQRLNAVAFQSRIGLEDDLRTGALVFLPLAKPGPFITELGVYLRQGRSLPVALDVFVSMVREHLATREAQD